MPAHPRARTLAFALIAALALSAIGCGTQPPGKPTAATPEPVVQVTQGGATASPFANPRTSRSATPEVPAASRIISPTDTPSPGTPSLRPAPLPAHTRMAVADPSGLVAPSCPRPSSVFKTVAISDLANADVGPTDDSQKLQDGTNHSVAASAWAYPASQVHDWMEGRGAPPGKKIAFLTFDDGPTGATTPQIQKILRDEGVHATFFVVGRQVNDKTAPVLRQSIADGHAVAIHSYGHDYHYLYPQRVANAQHISCDLDWARAAVRAALGPGYTSQAFRYPGGSLSWKGLAASEAAAKASGMTWIDWNSLSGDADAHWPHATPDDLVSNVFRSAQLEPAAQRNALVILNHDFFPNPKTVAALPTIIRKLKAAGYEFGIID